MRLCMVFASSELVVDASDGDFGLVVAFGAGREDTPGVELALYFGEGGVGECARLGVGWIGAGVEGAPAIGEAAGDDGAKGLRGGGEVAARVRVSKGREDTKARGISAGRRGVWVEVEFDGLAGVPVGGDLQDSGAAEAAVGDEHLLPERASHRSRLRAGSSG